ncbi:hypothetical protein LXA43DRAFT_1070347 [Ganoderma leucocontextum]|nr:hypothetical protein LXA43DRAFT_1070347 [Ganoderma leucocontextum]
MTARDENSPRPEELPPETWSTLPNLSPLSGSTIPTVQCARRFFIHSPSTILKWGTDHREGIMTALARSILGSCVPRVVSVVTIPRGATDLWPSLRPSQRETIKSNLCHLLVPMRAQRFTYYGRPARQPYLLFSEISAEEHAWSASRAAWDDSRVRALHASPTSSALGAKRVLALERVQRETAGAQGWDRPVLTHGDLSDRNILVDPATLTITGLLDWETANVMPAYFEYVAARLCGGHTPEWRKELLDVLRSVLRCECGIERRNDLKAEAPEAADVDGGEESYRRTLAAWDAIVDVERFAQEYGDDCYWTFQTGLSDAL